MPIQKRGAKLRKAVHAAMAHLRVSPLRDSVDNKDIFVNNDSFPFGKAFPLYQDNTVLQLNNESYFQLPKNAQSSLKGIMQNANHFFNHYTNEVLKGDQKLPSRIIRHCKIFRAIE